MDFNEIKELIRILEESGLSEIEVEEEGRRIRLQKYTVAPIPATVPLSVPVAGAEPEPEEVDITMGLPTIVAPMVGTFYSAPAPGEDVYINVGDEVEENQTVCIVEAMKLMNEVGSKFAGVIEKILVENGEPVEFGQPLFTVRVAD